MLQQELISAGIEVVVGKLANLSIQSNLLEDIRIGQRHDDTLASHMDAVKEGKTTDFSISSQGLLRYKDRVCVPDDQSIKKTILEEAHNTPYSVHPGSTKMTHDIKAVYWWLGMKKDIAEYVSKCLVCQQVKAEHQRPAGLLQPLSIPEWKWDDIAMDFVTGLPKTNKQHDSAWIVIDRLTKSAHFLPVKTSYTADQYADIYIQEIVRLHGIPKTIVSDRGSVFTSRFWRSLQQAMGTKLSLSTAFHPQTDGQSERTIQILEDMLRACILDFGGSWNKYLPLIEFSYNNSYQSTIGMAPYELLY